ARAVSPRRRRVRVLVRRRLPRERRLRGRFLPAPLSHGGALRRLRRRTRLHAGLLRPVKRRAGRRVTLARMGRWLAACPLALALLGVRALHADERARRPVVIIAPAPASCVLSDPLLVGIMNAGPFFASLVPASSVPETIPATTFQIEGTPEALHVRAWGL